MSNVAVVGGGAAGMMATCAAAANGHAVTLFEHNEKLGKKLFITGKGRCNLTNDYGTEDFFGAVSRNSKFLYSAVYQFDSRSVMQFFEEHGLRLKTERGNRVFPVSDHSSDVIRTLENVLKQRKVKVILHADVTDLLVEEGCVRGLIYNGKEFPCDAVIMATGGKSYPSTGSDGSGWEILQRVGHSCTALRPALTGMRTREDYILSLQGLSLKNVSVTVKAGTKKVFSDFGEMLFTHQGISGPVILTASSVIPDRYFQSDLSFEIDLKPSLGAEQLDRRLQRDFEENVNRQFKNALNRLLPAKLIPVIISLSGIEPEKKVNSITKEERKKLLMVLKHFPGTIIGLCGWREAIITRGGIRVKEVNPSTMESRIVQGLYLCGEMLDLDAVTGGYNLQIAWSTGHLAGASIPSKA
ncbi:MAG: NAD(P)/FAD-dependent oxidoreductase [Clostridiales bacterium]|nr:NAD(P)/FAD-dependent oxidoreductase [Clostridiales bacterium]